MKKWAVVLAVLAIAQVLYTLRPLFGTPMIDLAVYLRAVESVERGENPYVMTEIIQPGMSFLYPPGSLLLLVALSWGSAHQAGLAISVLTIAALFGALYFCLKILYPKFTTTEWLVISAFALQTFPVKLGLAMGQVNVIVLFFCALGLYFYTKNQKDWSGFFLAVAAVIKLYPMALIPLFIYKKEWRLLCVFGGIFVLLNLFYPSLIMPYFSTVLLDQLTMVPGNNPSFYDQSVTAMVFRMVFTKDIISYLQPLIMFGSYSFVFWKVKDWSFVKAAVMLLPLAVLLHYPAWQHQLVIAYPGILLLYPNRWLFLVWASLAFHYTIEYAFLASAPILAAVHTVVVLVVLVYLIFRGSAPARAS